jgi:serine phosphatase RsbU (regulator of sigma subunit)
VIREESIDLAKGTGLLLITDGLVECLNSRRDLFSRPRLLYTLEQLGNTSCASTVILKITAALEQFALGTAQEDDMTSIVILRE